MPAKLNKYFNNYGRSIGNKNERDLMQRLIDQAIQIHGFQITYIIRDENAEGVWREDTSPEFERSFTIEAFLESYDDFEGQGFYNNPYGAALDQMAKIWVSKARWNEENKLFPEKVPSKPSEGDLVLMTFGAMSDEKSPLKKGLDHVEVVRPKIFEIMHIQKEPDKFQVRGEYYYEIKMRLFDHSNEDISLINKNSDNTEDKNYEFFEQEMLNDLKTSGLDAIYANIDEDGNESGNIKNVVKTAQNRELEIESNKYSFELDGKIPTENPNHEYDCDCPDNPPPLQCDNKLPDDPTPFPLPEKPKCECDENAIAPKKGCDCETCKEESDDEEERKPIFDDKEDEEGGFKLPGSW